ncbi:Six-hairpin glycosidase-like protein [Annulohypoxylon maeteangense]|uniref:Six-hairpin glycosidase-like protein n=1 Tax=Annulohypoxylon maeteangense TaxID=1927788 RepID=UPI0020088072|nr:Six-hairpin glycosidase-like protein [Annulohypoxylon maeteangense]KAI0884012.1 Six-hairpin glycosidase-like protein [Annulohypoxylon maeteangense]
MQLSVAWILLQIVPLTLSLGTDYSGSHSLWYTTPGTGFTSGLAIGNGRIGALVLGSAPERIILNEASVWSGPYQNRVNPGARDAYPEVIDLLKSGQITAGSDLALQNLTATPTTNRAFSVTNDMKLDFGHSINQTSNYERWLDTLNGCTGLNYNYQNVTYNREVVAAFPSGVIAMRLNASVKASINVTISLHRAYGVLRTVASPTNGMIFQDIGGSDARSIAFSSGVRVISDIGKITSGDGQSLTVTGATTVDIFYDTETEFQWGTEDRYETSVRDKLNDAVSTGFEGLMSQSTRRHQSMMSRVNLDLGISNSSTALLPTDQRIANYEADPNSDKEFMVLMYNFGRHLLISSSSDTGGAGLGVPANLQGIWNDNYSPPWGSKYTVNINLQMNYWLAETTNLGDTLRPLWDLMNRSHQRGRDVAKQMYGCPGYVSHHNLDLWGDSAPHDNGTEYTTWAMSTPWLLNHMVEHYRFTGDKAFLRNQVWPLLVDSVAFYECYTFDFEGYLSSGPSPSPENDYMIPDNMSKSGSKGSIDVSPTMDNSLLYALFSSYMEAASALNISADEGVSTMRSRLRDFQIGQYGQIQEWRNDYAEAEQGHRHLSNLWDLFPGPRISPLTNRTLSDAARISLDRRNNGTSTRTGWSRAWMTACLARLLDGEAAINEAQALLQNHLLPNLFTRISGETFQIDSNFGYVAALTETLLQSHLGFVHLFPAPAPQIQTGSVNGLVARGGFQVSLSWKDGKFVHAEIESRLGGRLAIRVADGLAFKIDGEAIEYVETSAGRTYWITLQG